MPIPGDSAVSLWQPVWHGLSIGQAFPAADFPRSNPSTNERVEFRVGCHGSSAHPMIAALVKRLVGWEGMSEQQRYVARYRASSIGGRMLSMLPIGLPTLLRMMGSDKQMPGFHSYGPIYQQLFRNRKYRRIRLLEVGIGGYGDSLGGRSLLAWEAYFPFGTIIGADIVPKQMLGGGRRVIRHVDQSSADDVDRLSRQDGPFDIIIDDGSHFNAHQIFTFERLFEALRDGGVYIVEDVQTSFWGGEVWGVHWDGLAPHDPCFVRTCFGYFLELSKYLNHAEFLAPHQANPRLLALGRAITRISFVHNLIIIDKGPNTLPSAVQNRSPALAERSVDLP